LQAIQDRLPIRSGCNLQAITEESPGQWNNFDIRNSPPPDFYLNERGTPNIVWREIDFDKKASIL